MEPLKIGLTKFNFTFTDVLKFVEGRDEVGEFYKTIKEMQDNKVDLSLEKKWACGKVLMCKVAKKGVALPRRIQEKYYMEAVQKVLDGKWPDTDISQPAVPGSFTQPCKRGEPR